MLRVAVCLPARRLNHFLNHEKSDSSTRASFANSNAIWNNFKNKKLNMSVLSLKGAANNVLIYVDEDAMSCNVFSYNATEGIAIVNNSFIL